MKILIVGYGSIGARHAQILRGLGCKIAVVTSRTDCEQEYIFQTVAAAIEAFHPDITLISNTTDRHHATLEQLARAGFRGTVVIEKPAFAHTAAGANWPFAHIWVGYNLRFHPAIQRLRELLQGTRIFTANFSVGQHLDGWRQSRNGTDSYSGWKAQGGGVLRDLSHELDLAQWLLGPWKRVVADGGRLAQVTGDSEDAAALLLETRDCSIVTVQLDYLATTTHRSARLETEQGSIFCNLIAGSLAFNDLKKKFTLDKDETYRKQWEAVLGNDRKNLCTLEAGLESVKLIEACEASMASRTWIHR